MTTYNMNCTCGESMSLEAGSREEAVSMFKAGMTEEAYNAHMAQHHAGDAQKPTLEQVHGAIDQMVVAA